MINHKIHGNIGNVISYDSGSARFSSFPRRCFSYGSWTCVPDIIPKGISVRHIISRHYLSPHRTLPCTDQTLRTGRSCWIISTYWYHLQSYTALSDCTTVCAVSSFFYLCNIFFVEAANIYPSEECLEWKEAMDSQHDWAIARTH